MIDRAISEPSDPVAGGSPTLRPFAQLTFEG